MAKLPISRVVDTTVTRADRFPTRAGFGVPIIVTSQAGAVVDATTRTRLYGSMEEVALDWAAGDEAYKAAQVVFSQQVRPPTLKIGWVSPDILAAAAQATATINPAGVENSLIYTADAAGGAGNNISVRYVNPGTANAALSVVVTGSAIVVNLATDGASAVITTAADIQAAIAASAAAAALVDVAIDPADGGLANGSGVVTAMPATFLAGGLPLLWGDQMDDLYDYDSDWYWLTLTREFRDRDDLDDLIAWAEAKSIQFFLDSNDPLVEDRADTTNVAARNKGGPFDRTSVYYHTDPNAYFAAAAAGYAATRNFDQADTAYTLKFKPGRTIAPLDRPSWAVQGITGFVPALGLDEDEGHFANAYVDIGGIDMIVEGTVLSGAFVDEIHASDWLIARTQESVLSALTNNARVPYTDTGVQILVAAVESVMQRASVAGLIADVTDPETGELMPDYEFEVERVSAIPAAQRRQRIAPDIRCVFRYAGAIHYVTVRFTMKF